MALTISDATVRIADLLTPQSVSLAGMQATNVTFLGPAVLLAHGDITFAGDTRILNDADGILWDIPEHQKSVLGAIDIKDSVFTNCTFFNIGFAGRHSHIQALAQAMFGTDGVPDSNG